MLKTNSGLYWSLFGTWWLGKKIKGVVVKNIKCSSYLESRNVLLRNGKYNLKINRNWISRLLLNSAKCCGIVGYIGNQPAEGILREGIEILQNRGYDSCGITTINSENEFVTTKFASLGTTSDCIDRLAAVSQERHKDAVVGIGHTRWATHGEKKDQNAHPHSDSKGRISLVHNGTIDNYRSIYKDLLGKGYSFVSETDTEVIAVLIGNYLDNGYSFEEACLNAIDSLQGTWGLCILHKDYPHKIVLARNGSPILIGRTQNSVFVSSEPNALARYTNEYTSLNDGEIAVVTKDSIDYLKRTNCTNEVYSVDKTSFPKTPFPYKHWTIKEIYEQPEAISRALSHGGRISQRNAVKLGGLDYYADQFTNIRNLFICGCGTSFYASVYGEYLMRWLGIFDSVRAIDAGDFDTSISKFSNTDSCIILVSQSGETYDTLRCFEAMKSFATPTFSVVNVVGSLLARKTGIGVYCHAGREVGVASTKTFTSQVAVLSLIAIWFAKRSDHQNRIAILFESILRLPLYVSLCLQNQQFIQSLAAEISSTPSILILGKGFGYPIALEGALKLKEMAYVHAEGFNGSALKHGPFALIDPEKKTPVILIILSDEHTSAMLNAASQVKAKGAKVIVITDNPCLVEGIADHIISVPENGPLSALLCAIPLQLLAYHLALEKNVNPDKPRGLAKTVTVL